MGDIPEMAASRSPSHTGSVTTWPLLAAFGDGWGGLYGARAVALAALAIGLAVWSKQVYPSLFLGIWLAWTILSGWNPVTGLILAVDRQGRIVMSTGPIEPARGLFHRAKTRSPYTLGPRLDQAPSSGF